MKWILIHLFKLWNRTRMRIWLGNQFEKLGLPSHPPLQAIPTWLFVSVPFVRGLNIRTHLHSGRYFEATVINFNFSRHIINPLPEPICLKTRCCSKHSYCQCPIWVCNFMSFQRCVSREAAGENFVEYWWYGFDTAVFYRLKKCVQDSVGYPSLISALYSRALFAIEWNCEDVIFLLIRFHTTCCSTWSFTDPRHRTWCNLVFMYQIIM